MTPPAATVSRVSATAAALALIDRLETLHGPLVFHQSGGCCDGSVPMCFTRSEFRIGEHDVRLGEVGHTPFYIGGAQFEYWQHTHLILDAAPGRGASFSLETSEGMRFFIDSRLYTDAEWARLSAAPV